MHAQSPVLNRTATVTLFLCGDVMTGRGIDQILPHPGVPSLHERFADSAAAYVRLAEVANGPIPHSSEAGYVWGDALDEFRRVAPDLKVINLETAVTTSDEFERIKEVHYRMHPANIACLTAAGIQCCALANNHVLDWGQAGLVETLETLADADTAAAGAGRDLDEAVRPAIFDYPGKCRVLVFACGCESSGVPSHWAATDAKPGIWLVDEYSPAAVNRVASAVCQWKRPGDVVVLSVHWGNNWGYDIPLAQQDFAHNLIDRAGVDVVHGHSSHHVKGLEVYGDRPIFYGCGDLLTDYEGIAGREKFRDDLGLMYFVTLDVTTGALLRLDLVPTQIKRFRLTRPGASDVAWLAATLNREGRGQGTSVAHTSDDRLTLRWPSEDKAQP